MNATSCYWSYIDFYTLITYNYILTHTYNSDTTAGAEFISSPQRCSWKICKVHRKAPVLESLFYKVASLQACNVTKNRLLHKCFHVKFEKFWRTPILKNIWTTISVYWLLHHILHYSTYFTFFNYFFITQLKQFFSFWKLKISFTEMFRESAKKTV